MTSSRSPFFTSPSLPGARTRQDKNLDKNLQFWLRIDVEERVSYLTGSLPIMISCMNHCFAFTLLQQICIGLVVEKEGLAGS